MIGFAETLGAVLATFLLPAFAGLIVISVSSRFLGPKYLAAFAIGLYLWFFSDTIGDASFLGVSEGFSGGVTQAALWIVFIVGVLLFLSLDGKMFTEGDAGTSFGFAIPLLVAVAVGVHGFGEGAAVGATAATTSSTSLIDAFGGLSAGAAFVLHKTLEPMMVGAAYWVYAREHAKDLVGRLRDMAVLTVAFPSRNHRRSDFLLLDTGLPGHRLDLRLRPRTRNFNLRRAEACQAPLPRHWLHHGISQGRGHDDSRVCVPLYVGTASFMKRPGAE